MNYRKGSFLWAVQEMKKGRFVRCRKWIKGLYYFTQCKKLIGNNPYNRLYVINLHNFKCINLKYVNLRPIDSGFYFLNDFLANDWISKNIIVKGGAQHEKRNRQIST